MTETTSKNTDNVKINLFLRHLSLAKKKIDERKKAKQGLLKQIKRVRNISLPKKKKIILEREIKVLESKINELIDTEKKLFTQQQQEFFFSKVLEKRISALEEKINEFLSYRKERKKKIEELEQKIKKKSETRTEKIEFIKSQIKTLEDKYNELKKSKIYDEDSLKKIEKKIENLKQKITGP